jgi:hypothetical protein
MNVLKVRHGGRIKYSGNISATEVVIFKVGRVLSPVDADGTLKVADATAGKVKGLVMKDRLDYSAIGPTTNALKGAPSGEMASMLLDEAVVEVGLSGNQVAVANESLYVSADGYVCTGGGGDIVGKVLVGNGVAGQPAIILWSVQY